MNIAKYLQRIGLESAEIKIDLESLRLLQNQHLLNVPFENLDIHWGNRIELDISKFYQKIIDRKRGGFCYELNGLFCELLNVLGYKCRIISARVSEGKCGFGEEYDHLAIIVSLDEKEYLVDVGFGDFTAFPLTFELETEQKDANGIFAIKKRDENFFEVSKLDENESRSEYIFKDVKRELSEFEGMCNFHQTSKESHFTRGKVCSLLTEKGRKTLTNKKFIETIGVDKTEVEINNGDDFNKILKREFGIRK